MSAVSARAGVPAAALAVPRRAVRIVSRHAARTRVVEVEGATTEAIARLAAG